MSDSRAVSKLGVEVNRELWESWTRVNIKSDFYDVQAFKRGETQLDQVAAQGVGDVCGKSLLHLQCHFGLDTLDLARRGARVVGVDFSKEAGGFAGKLAREISVSARFICANIYELSEHLDERFDAYSPHMESLAGGLTSMLGLKSFRDTSTLVVSFLLLKYIHSHGYSTKVEPTTHLQLIFRISTKHNLRYLWKKAITLIHTPTSNTKHIIGVTRYPTLSVPY